MTQLSRIQVGEVVFANVRGRSFYAEVVKPAHEDTLGRKVIQVTARPGERPVPYALLTSRDVILRHPKQSADPLPAKSSGRRDHQEGNPDGRAADY